MQKNINIVQITEDNIIGVKEQLLPTSFLFNLGDYGT